MTRTNVPTQLWEATRRSSILVPLRIRTSTNSENRSFVGEVQQLAEIVCSRDGYIVLLGPEAGQFGTIRQANEIDFSSLAILRVVRRFDDGVILGANAAVACKSSSERGRDDEPLAFAPNDGLRF